MSKLESDNPTHGEDRDAVENQENLLRFPARDDRASANRATAETARVLDAPFGSASPHIPAPRPPLISTKLSIPRPPRDLNRRQRLAQVLDQAIYKKVILISAPAGSGKTTILTEWHSSSEEGEVSLAWVSLDEDDNDPQRFWSYFAAALNTIAPGVGEHVLDSLHSVQIPSMQSVLTLLINDVTSISEDFALVLDDYHLIQSQEIHDGLSFLIDHLPPHMHLIISSRSVPPLQLSRLRARGELAEFRAADLRFEQSEIHSLFKQAFNLELSDDELKLLEERTEGWIAGLRMAALSMPRDGGLDEFFKGITGTSRHILDYLVDEVFEAQPESIKSFLIKTSVLARLNASLCDATADLTGSQAILDDLDKSNLFIVSLDIERQWYRYHHLFSEFLRGRLLLDGTDRIQELHTRAALWYEEHGLRRQAISHYLTIHDYGNAVRLIDQLAGPMLASSEVSTLQTWLEALPDEFVVSDPRLCLSYAQAMLYRGQENAALPWFDKAELGLNALENPVTEDRASSPRFAEKGKEIERMRGELAALRGTQASIRGRVDDAIQYCKEALERLSEEDTLARARVAYNLGMAYLHRDENDFAEQQFIQAKELAIEAGDIHLGVIAHTWASRVQHRRGQLRKAADTCKEAIELATGESGSAIPAASLAHLGLGDIYYERNELESAADYYSEAIATAERGNRVGDAAYGRVARVMTRHAMGYPDDPSDVFRTADRLIREHDLSSTAYAVKVASAQARLLMARNDLDAASNCLTKHNISIEDEFSPRWEAVYLTLARLLVEQALGDSSLDQIPTALKLLDDILENAEASGRIASTVEILSLEALAYDAVGKRSKALELIERAISLAHNEGYVRTFVDLGQPMSDMLKLLTRKGDQPEYVDKLILAFNVNRPPDVQSTQTRQADHIEQLSDRELEVLGLLVKGNSNRLIASELFVSVNTVKTHLKNVYGKLGVHGRTQAVVRASELDIF